ncbi:Flagellar basal body rod protein FlgB [Buchnera aphidicola (Eriosoma grossulariae)]|uniref:flagellar basal body rod protein FlgB n=1 Tax=Buchnera aphidicola TaxID=9 RepID=UPI003463B556
MFNKIQSAFQFNNTALDLITYRQEILASNIANSETPNYKSKDINFTMELKKATNEKINTPSLKLYQTSAHHISHKYNHTLQNVKIINNNIKNKTFNNNSVNMNVERVKFLENTMAYQTILTLLNHQIKNMFNVIQG